MLGWVKKVTWFKKDVEVATDEVINDGWTHTYLNVFGEVIRCKILKVRDTEVTEILNENNHNVLVKNIKLNKII